MSKPTPPVSAEDWDAVYTGEDGDEPMWSGRPNGALVVEVSDMTPGRVLDVGCGEGADAVWLAERGWDVTALEPSGVALGRARTAAAERGVEIDWLHAGLAEADLATYDLVSLQYPAIPKGDDGLEVRALLDAVGPGGTLLIVHHAQTGAGGEHGMGGHGHDEPHGHAHDPNAGDDHDHGEHGFDPSGYVMPADVAAALDDAWFVEVDETRPRADTPEHGKGAGHVEDIVLRIRRA